MKSVKKLIKHNKIGVAILLLGGLAIVMVGQLAVQKFTVKSADDEGAISQAEVENFKNNQVSSPEIKNNQTKPSKKLHKRQSKITESDIRGAWDTRLEKGRALLQLNNGKYKIIIVMDDANLVRSYSNGTYILDKGLLMLIPDASIPPPASKRFPYKLLTRSKLPVAVTKYKGKIIWYLPDDQYDIYVPNHHPFFALTQDNIVAWKVLE